MDIKSIINSDENIILITPQNIKRQLLKIISNQNKLTNIKIMSKNEFLDLFYPKYDDRALVYLVTKLSYKLSFATTILDNIRYLDNEFYNDDILNDLVKIRKILETENLVNQPLSPKNIFKNKKVYLYGCTNTDVSLSKLMDQRKIKYEIIDYENLNKDLTIYEVSTLNDEVAHVASYVIDLINKGVDITRIKLANVSNEYIFSIKKTFKMFNINVNLAEKSNLYDYEIAHKFINAVNNFNNFEDLIKHFKTMTLLGEEVDLLNKIIDVVNDFSFYKEDIKYLKEILVYKLKNQKVTATSYSSSVEVINLLDYYITDEYVIILGFNEDSIPRAYKNNDYISDFQKEIIGISSSKEKNINEINTIKSRILSIENLYISYKLESYKGEHHPSILISELGDVNVMRKQKVANTNYSKLFDQIRLTKYLDNLIKYNVYDKEMDKLYKNNKVPYLEFDNKFKVLTKSTLKKCLGDELRLSYSALDTYNNCAFKYYIEKVLRIKSFTETPSLFIGNLFHHVLSLIFKVDKSVETLVDEYYKSKNVNMTEKDKIYKELYTNSLINLIAILNENKEKSSFDDYEYECEIKIVLDRSIKVTLLGFIDKILTFYDGINTYAIVIDYKTGSYGANVNNVVHGLDMQLLMYLYLLKQSRKLENMKPAGFYIQSISPEIFARKKDKTINELRKEHYKLSGYTLENVDIARLIDNDYINSSVVSGLKLKNDGTFYSSSKVLKGDVIDKLMLLVEKNIESSIDNITTGNFSINPKIIENNSSCAYCEYADICYHKTEDNVYLNSYKDLEFLGGDEA